MEFKNLEIGKSFRWSETDFRVCRKVSVNQYVTLAFPEQVILVSEYNMTAFVHEEAD